MDKIIKMLLKYAALFAFGGTLYVLAEMFWRGYSHWSMFASGGVCFVLIGLINEWKQNLPFLVQGVIGSAVITLVELIVGYIVNIRLGWNVWDYSDMPFNFMGQICLAFSILWIFVSMVAVVFDDWLRFTLFHEDWPDY